jgi:hypothetical protein
MKSIIISGIAILILFTTVISGSLALSEELSRLYGAVDAATTSEEYREAEALFQKYKKLYALAIGDTRLVEISYSFDEVICFTEFGTEDEAKAAKSRLLSHIEFERRLSKFCIDAVL